MALSDDDKEYIKSLGLVTSSRIMRDDVDVGSGRSDRQSRNNELRSMLTRIEHQTAIVSVETDVVDKFASAMVSVIQPVRVTGAVRDIVNPLYDRLRVMNEEQSQIEAQRHIESTLYSSRMLESINRLNKANATSSRGIYLAIREFQNAPLLKSLTLAMKGMMSVTKFGFNLAFGFKKKKSDAELIVDAIKRQTEWMMTGQIKQQNWILVRLFREGLLGVPMKRMLQLATGLTLERAQEVEDAKARGESVTNIGDIAARWLMRNRVTLRGRPDPGIGPESTGNVAGVAEPTLVTIDQNSSPFVLVHDKQLFLEFNGYKDTILHELFMRNTREVNQHAAVVSRIGQVIEHDKKALEFVQTATETQQKNDEKVVKWTKETRDEVRAHRRQTFWMGMLRMGAGIVSGIAGLGSKVGKILAGLTAGKFIRDMLPGGRRNRAGGRTGGGGRGLGGRLGGAWERARGVGGKLLRNPRAMLGVGGMAGLGFTMLGDHVGRDTRMGAGLNAAGSIAAGASTGALIGSFIPGVGTVIGGTVGGLYGAYRGYRNNRDALHGIKEYPWSGAPMSTPRLDVPIQGQMNRAQLNRMAHPDLGRSSDFTVDYINRLGRNTTPSGESDLDQATIRLESSLGNFASSIENAEAKTAATLIEEREVLRRAMEDLSKSIDKLRAGHELQLRLYQEIVGSQPMMPTPSFSRR